MSTRPQKRAHFAPPSAPPKARRKPFGYDLIMGVSPSFIVLTLGIMLFVCWWQSVRLDRLIGRESQLYMRRVLDGDTFLANTEDGYLVKVRLRAVDAPELDQPYGKESSQALRSLLMAPHTDVVSFIHERDFDGRYIADVFTQTAVSEFRYVQAKMVRSGLAWHYGAFDRRVKLKEMMENATAAKVGLWKDPDPLPPWRFRREKEKQVCHDDLFYRSLNNELCTVRQLLSYLYDSFTNRSKRQISTVYYWYYFVG